MAEYRGTFSGSITKIGVKDEVTDTIFASPRYLHYEGQDSEIQFTIKVRRNLCPAEQAREIMELLEQKGYFHA